ncbi:MAG TPA: AMP-binding protein [Pyrinomonadaceae bacterium]|nr:AMP-binding protein [Pyrinomonadaceae bacterium]
MQASFCKQLIDSFESRPDKVAMRIVGDNSQVYTFGETLAQIRSVAYRMSNEDVAFGDRVALIGENHPCWAIAYLATLYHGAVCVPLDPHGEIETITNFLENSEAKLAFIGSDLQDKFGKIQEKLGRHIPAVVWDVSAKVSVQNLNGFKEFSEWSRTDFPESFAGEIPKAAGDDIALLIYTSGTTGTPKGVPLTHENIVAELSGVNDVLKLSDKETILSLLPLFHAYLQIVNLWVATTFGIEVGYLKELSPAELGSAMKEFKPTILTTVPRLWYLFHKKIFDAVEEKPKVMQRLFSALLTINGTLRDSFGVNLGHKFFGEVHESFGGRLRLAVTAGSRFDDEVARDFHRLGFTILQGYGLTETSGAATATHETDNRVGSVGKPMTGAEIKIADPDKDGIGEVLIRGPIVFKGYYKNPTATAEAFTDDGWFKSGDLGQIDKDGHLHIVGRAKDVIVLPSGKNVHPEDLEVHYLKAPEVEELAIIGVADKSEQRAGAEKLAAIVVPDFEYLRQAKVANSKEAIRYALDDLGRELPEYQRVRDYIIRAEPLPRTATRKIKRFELKKEIESGKLGGETREPKTWSLSDEDISLLATDAGKAVISAIKQNAKDASTIHPEMNLEIDLGLDSLARAETFAALEHAFSTEFDADEAAKALTVRDVVALIESHGTAGTASLVPVETELNWSKIVKETDEDFPEIRAVLRNRPLFSGFAYLVYSIFNLFCRIFMSLEIQGRENLESMIKQENGKLQPFIICPNHQSYLDPFVLCSNYPFILFRNIFHVGASMFFESRIMRWIATLLNVVPIDPDTQLMRAMKAGAIGLKHGKILNIYPEGERAYDGELHQFKKGAAILATELDIPILPVAIDGLHKVWARRSWRIRPAKVTIRFGKPFTTESIIPSDNAALETREQTYTAVTSHLRQTISEMIADMRKQRS